MKENITTKRLNERLDEIKVDIKNDASLSFLSRKYMVARVTIKKYLISKGLID